MSHEIEAKIKVDKLEPFCEKLAGMGAVFVHDARQVDTYFMDTHKLLHKKDCGLRIRRQVIEGTHSALITFKGARNDSAYKSRPEFETGVDNPETMTGILEALGYHKRLTVEKQRSIWRLDGCEICLDTLVDLGCFVEVEGADEDAIEAVLKKLKLENEPHIAQGYARLTEQRQKSMQEAQTDTGRQA